MSNLGFLITDEITLDTGVKVSNSYCYLDRQEVKFQMAEDDSFTMSCIVSVWKDVVSHDELKLPIKQHILELSGIPYMALGASNPIVIIYDYLKGLYTATVDVV